MTRLFVTVTVVAAAIFLAACGSQEDTKKKSHKFGDGSTAITDIAPTPAPSPTPDESTPPPHTEVQNPNSTGPVTTKQGDVPYATPVPGRPGFVTSPFAPYSGYVDVRGFPPGTEVKCPYTGKTFLVP
jgi:uncharacterized lipoprotein